MCPSYEESVIKGQRAETETLPGGLTYRRLQRGRPRSSPKHALAQSEDTESGARGSLHELTGKCLTPAAGALAGLAGSEF